jgi:ribokinase
MGLRSVWILGSINLDIVTQVATLPRPGETVAGFRTDEIPGGKGANQAVATARMGGEVRLIAALGRDDYGRDLKTFLSGAGVKTEHLVEVEGQSTGRAFICVEVSGENLIVVNGGANLALRPEHLPIGSMENSVLLAQLETPLETVSAFFQRGSRDTSLRLLNAAPAHPAAKSLFDSIDILILNETELQSLAGLKKPPRRRTQLVDAARSLMPRPDQSAIVTLGAAGSLLVTPTDARMIEGRKVPAVDTTGAGDCFCGVLAAFLAEGAALPDAVARANAAAALSVCKTGAAVSMPYRAELDAFNATGVSN